MNKQLICAIEKDDINEVKKLIEAGAHVNIPDKTKQESIFHQACRESGLEMVKLLLYAGANAERKNMFGETPLHSACRGGNQDIVKFLINAGVVVDPKKELVLSMGFSVTEIGSQHTPLHMACIKGKKEIAKLLIDAGANIEAKNDYGETPLHLACWCGNKNIVKLLIDAGAKIEAKNEKYMTTLHVACILENREIVKLLIDAGADLTAKDKWKRTPFQLLFIENSADKSTYGYMDYIFSSYFMDRKNERKLEKLFKKSEEKTSTVKKKCERVSDFVRDTLNEEARVSDTRIQKLDRLEKMIDAMEKLDVKEELTRKEKIFASIFLICNILFGISGLVILGLMLINYFLN